MVADGAGVFYLLRQWASLSKQMLENQLVAEPLPELPVNFDHLIFWNKLAESSKDVHPYVDYVLQQENDSNLGSMQQDFETLCNTGNISLQKTLNTRILHLSAEGIARLSSDFNKAGSEQSIHGVQIFYALLWQRYIVASQSVQCKGGEQDDAAEKPVFLNILHNIRHMVCDAASYVGNAVTGVYVSEMPSTLLQMPVIETTRFIKSHINRITPGAAVNITEQSFNPKSDFILRVLSLQRKFGVCMAISNVSKLPFSNLDFGIGAVAAMISGTLPTEGMTSWMPHVSEDGKGGVDIYCGLQQDVYEKMKNDDMLAKYAQFKN
ncbi:hypothetical protein FB639_001641 [Coemansia asiatica]|nr:hypothetical protein FB639_001641 [Coemansia asiatica]